ncbi:MAG: beta-N-acetylhexosaminidase [Muribaculaceae bacterium]|nr:beta-N-acetylhexosaminidase [Muribaculaceae bacterium]
MKILYTAALLLIASLASGLCRAQVPIVPLPVSMTANPSGQQFNTDRKLTASVQGGDSVLRIAHTFFDMLPGKVTEKTKNADITFAVNPELGPEAYTIDVTPKKLTVKASRPAGFFYAVQTLSQAMQPTGGKSIPAMAIADEPRFGWRGFMLDEGRHIYGKDEVKRILDLMALYKLNRFHWHLTEDQGWRIEIKKYPKLTEVGAWRDSEVLGWDTIQPKKLDKPYGGFYTQDDIREIVEYARDRFIEVMPEIDIPGHTRAAVAAYPEILACDPENPHEVWLWQGVTDDVMNVANPTAVQMSKDIIDELIPLFPFGYLHLGGDECPTTKWKTNEQCVERLKEIGSDNYRDLQLDFYRQLQNHINAKPESEQRKLVFWNEVLHGNTSMLDNDDIVIMAWVGADKAALEAASRGLETILTPQIPYYINRKQSTDPGEPRTQGRGTETVEAVYSYVPMNNTPDSLKSKYKGVQANFWSEYVPTAELLEYLILPRLAAVSEAAWTPQEKRSYDSFLERIRGHEPIYRARGYNYAPHVMKR